MSSTTVNRPAAEVEPAARIAHALYSSWTAAECGAPGWTAPFWVGGVNCPDCLAALPVGAAGIAVAGGR